MSLLPLVTTRENFAAVFSQDEVWEPAIRFLMKQHHIEGSFSRAMRGSHIVYRVGNLWLKLMAPLFAKDMPFEIAGLKSADGKLSVKTPEIKFEGELEDWKYLITTEVPGRRIGEVWASLSPDHKISMARQIGRVTMELQKCNLSEQILSRGDWNTFIESQIKNVVEHHRGKQLPEVWLKGLQKFIDGFSVSEFTTDQPVFLHADLTYDHFLITDEGGVSGVIDFADCRPGHREYDLPASLVFIFKNEPEALRAYLQAMDLNLTPEKMMAWTLLHRYSDLRNYFVREMQKVPQDRLGDFSYLAKTVFGVPGS